MLRRNKDILNLPRRTDIMIPLELDGQDKTTYNLAKRATIQYLDDIISSETGGNGYMNAISKINALRMVCNLGSSMNLRDATPSDATSTGTGTGNLNGAFGVVDKPLDDDDLTGLPSTCTICGILISGKSSSQCLSCCSDAIGTIESSQDGVPMSQLDSQFSNNVTFQGDRSSSRVFPTKIKALVNDLKSQRHATKRSVYTCTSTWLKLANLCLASCSRSGSQL